MKTFNQILLCLFSVFGSFIYAQESDDIIIAKIQQTDVEGMINLKAVVSNNSSNYQQFSYLFIAIKKGDNGNISNNKQAGKFTLNPNETKKVTEINLNLQNKDALKAYLYIRDEEKQKLITKDSLEINFKILNTKSDRNESKQLFELKGLTIDETKTKIGKDFYDTFYLEYSKLTEKAPSAITVTELPTIGRSSQISIKIDDKTIYQFMSNPSDEYLEEQAKLTLKIINDYQQKNNLLTNEFRY